MGQFATSYVWMQDYVNSKAVWPSNQDLALIDFAEKQDLSYSAALRLQHPSLCNQHSQHRCIELLQLWCISGNTACSELQTFCVSGMLSSSLR